MNFLTKFILIPYLALLSLSPKYSFLVAPRESKSIAAEKAKKFRAVSKLAEMNFYVAPTYPVRIYRAPEKTEPVQVVDVPESVRKAKEEAGISCGYDIDTYRTPRSADYFFAFKQTAADGAWGTGSTWVGGVAPVSGDQVQINHHVTTAAGTTNVASIFVASAGWLEFPSGTSSKIVSTGNVEVQGLWSMKPSSVSVVHQLEFTGINENNFVGGGMDVLSTDVGFWIMAGGRVDLVGTTRKPWSNASATVSAGATSMTVNDVTGWQIGDEIVIAPTGKPVIDGLDYTTVPVDPFMAQFERKIITNIVGNVVSWSGGLVYNHAAVSSSITSATYGTSTRNWTAEVANLTRNVKIGGSSATSRSHMFIRNTIQTVQNIQYVQFKWLGPRKVNPAIHSSRPSLVSGRYGIHFHFGNYFSQNSLVYGCSMSDIGNRGYVPHETHKIEMSNNVAFDYMETAFWWDENELSHFITWNDNLLMGARWNGGVGPAKHTSMQINQGDGNQANRNVIVYGSQINLHGNGGYTWEANSEGVWGFVGNMAHSSTTGLWVWQNTSLNHTIVDYDSYNNTEGITHGAYTNSYQYTGGHHYRSLCFIEATSANTNGVVFKDIFFDAGGEPFGVTTIESPVPSPDHKSNKLVQCVIKNYATAGVEFQGGGVGGFAERKQWDFIQCDIGNNDGSEVSFNTTYAMNESSRVRIQRITGLNKEIIQTSGSLVTTNGIADFAPRSYGDGILGLLGEYYDDNNLSTFAFTRYDAILMFDVWHPDGNINPNGVHHLVTQAHEEPVNSGNMVVDDDVYSIRWTGRVEAHYTANTTFTITGSGKYRMYFDDGGGEDLIIDQWATTSGAPPDITSSPIALTAGTKYNVRLEFINLSSGAQGFAFYWKTPQMATNQIVPQSQLFEPTSNSAPTVDVGSDRTIQLPTSSVSVTATASDIDGTIASYAWTKISGPGTPTIVSSSSATTSITGLLEGTYVFQCLVTDNDGATDSDQLTVIVNAAGNVAPTVVAGSDQTITLPVSTGNLLSSASDPDGSIVSYSWAKTSGPSTFTITNASAQNTTATGLIEGTYVFTVTATDDGGLTATDQVQITVNPAAANQAPTVNAGNDQTITLPTSSVFLQGTANDPDGSIVAYQWTQVSGPNTASNSTPASIETTMAGLIEGTYVFQLFVRDNGADDTFLTATDQVTVIVLPATVNPRKYMLIRYRKRII